jgi:hypothetical protein
MNRNRLIVTMDPGPGETRVLMMEGPEERLRAILGPSTRAHPRAAETLLEGLSLWHQQALSVVLCAGGGEGTWPSGLEDALGFGVKNVHFEVEVALVRGRRPHRLLSLGNFGDLRRLCLTGGVQ